MKTLLDCQERVDLRIVQITGGRGSRLRLSQLGLGIDSTIRLKRNAPFSGPLVISFEGSGKTVAEINWGLLARGIFGGKDLSWEFQELAQSALYCVTELHTKDDIDRLAGALEEVING